MMWPLMIVLLLANLASATVTCPDGSSCPDQSKCCKLESGNYDCCLLEKTTRCDTMHSPLDDSGDSSPLSMALEYSSTAVKSKTLEMETVAPSGSVKSDSLVIYCDTTHYCPNGYICCHMQSGGWSCCPHLLTVCCYGGMRCCPSDYTGDISPSSMMLEYNSIPVEGKTLKMETGPPGGSLESDSLIVHCDAMYYCPAGNRCCHMQSGYWSCCPYPTKVCCYGGTRCCPQHDYSGDISPSSMALEYNTIAVESKTLEMETQALSTSVSIDSSIIYCDDKHYCLDGSTCCRSQSGVWSCCPHPEAVCCKDGVHCCPHGSKCDLQRLRCTMDNHSIPWLTKIPAQIESEALLNSASNEGSLVYCDDTHVCKAGSTCCKTWHKGWECCPFPKAHCCWDGLHCCPRFHYCDIKRNICKRYFPGNNWIQLSSVKNAEKSEKI